MSPDVIDLQPQHIPAAAQTLTQAFRDDPLFRYLYGDLDLYDRVAPWMFGTWVKWSILYGKAWASPGIEAVALRRQPGRYRMSTWSMIRAGMLPTERKMGKAAFQRLQRFLDAAEDAHTAIMGDQPHWYCQNVAVAPEHQGRGLGGVLMNHTFALADAAGLPCYLETETDKALAIHSHLGYELRRTIDLSDGAFRFYAMVRPPGATVRHAPL